jgi:hypothetical protein
VVIELNVQCFAFVQVLVDVMKALESKAYKTIEQGFLAPIVVKILFFFFLKNKRLNE